MPQFHIDDKINRMLVELDNELCTFERTAGRGYTLALIPRSSEERIHVSINGKPVDTKILLSKISVLELLQVMLNTRL